MYSSGIVEGAKNLRLVDNKLIIKIKNNSIHFTLAFKDSISIKYTVKSPANSLAKSPANSPVNSPANSLANSQAL